MYVQADPNAVPYAGGLATVAGGDGGPGLLSLGIVAVGLYGLMSRKTWLAVGAGAALAGYLYLRAYTGAGFGGATTPVVR